MSEVNKTPPYVYQPFGVQDRDHWAAGRIYAVTHESDLVTLSGLTEDEAYRVRDALQLGSRPISSADKRRADAGAFIADLPDTGD